MLRVGLGPALAGLSLVAMAAPSDAPSPKVAVPAGSFQQGSATEADAPLRTVTLSAFQIDRDEVSIAAFEAFVAAGGYSRPELWTEPGRAWLAEHPQGAGANMRTQGRPGDHPVVAVGWFEADAYCRWRQGSLPTEAQWEHAACGEGGRRYPWGDQDAVDAAWFDAGKFGHLDGVSTQPVAEDTAPAGPLGLNHTVGNVWEWTADWYNRDSYRQEGDALDPVGPANGLWRVLRGGSYMNLPSYATCAHREPARPDRVALTVGFRCAYPQP